jgi:hypothetical protein
LILRLGFFPFADATPPHQKRANSSTIHNFEEVSLFRVYEIAMQ